MKRFLDPSEPCVPTECGWQLARGTSASRNTSTSKKTSSPLTSDF